ncbi:MAG TPA: sulfotransferase [Rhizomicrobium sp.]|nr:sulfotransferase [Rhizomicrobium sp.]
MSDTTQPFFIVSSGRSGTAMLHKALTPVADMQHEYMAQITQPLAVRRYLGLVDAETALKTLTQTHVAAIGYSAAAHWGDSSNKLSWLIPELAQLLPSAKFVHLVRDGRKVAGSYFRKLGAECYDDRSTRIMQAHYDDPSHTPAPPPEKKYWWPVPRRDDPLARAFRSYSQFERICWHWAEINGVIIRSLATLPRERHIFVRLEELRESPVAVKGLYDFLKLPYAPDAFAVFAKPHNVNKPQDRLLDQRERARFDAIAGEMMSRLGYAERAEYVVNY